MRKLLIAVLLLPVTTIAAESPLLSAPANNVSEWKEKLKEFEP